MPINTAYHPDTQKNVHGFVCKQSTPKIPWCIIMFPSTWQDCCGIVLFGQNDIVSQADLNRMSIQCFDRSVVNESLMQGEPWCCSTCIPGRIAGNTRVIFSTYIRLKTNGAALRYEMILWNHHRHHHHQQQHHSIITATINSSIMSIKSLNIVVISAVSIISISMMMMIIIIIMIVTITLGPNLVASSSNSLQLYLPTCSQLVLRCHWVDVWVQPVMKRKRWKCRGVFYMCR